MTKEELRGLLAKRAGPVGYVRAYARRGVANLKHPLQNPHQLEDSRGNLLSRILLGDTESLRRSLLYNATPAATLSRFIAEPLADAYYSVTRGVPYSQMRAMGGVMPKPYLPSVVNDMRLAGRSISLDEEAKPKDAKAKLPPGPRTRAAQSRAGAVAAGILLGLAGLAGTAHMLDSAKAEKLRLEYQTKRRRGSASQALESVEGFERSRE